MKVTFIVAPYDSGQVYAGFGQGPEALIAGGLVEELTLNGHDIEVRDIGEVGDAPREISTGFAVCAVVAKTVGEALGRGRFPIVLAGNCLTSVGAVAREAADSIVWFDQHADINTPDTSTTGFLDGMALAAVLGLCWRGMTGAIPGFTPIDPARCLLAGARDLDAAETRLLEELPVIRAACGSAPEKMAALKAAGATCAHLHLDLDVLDPEKLQVNRYAGPGGPDPEQLRNAVCGLVGHVPIAGMTISAYDPAFDPRAEVPPVVGKMLADFLAAMERSR
ncbi:arginase [Mesorhizobium sp. Root554]|uniref:arginase family protein n=1 Tax=unclassified Mesorhizobium TaxID=325217 RepID=UPI0006FCC0CC|nr:MULTISPECIES: arginase family protein [unclassified Mesorhizobium]KQZ15292.1 arginase [Mesorhizobium sp. Root1471]KQZ37800.1 arginase [Mesorhizobium sp. Root554]